MQKERLKMYDVNIYFLPDICLAILSISSKKNKQ